MKTIITVADTMMGYGSPQVIHFVRSLSDILGCNYFIFQPFLPQKKFIDLTHLSFNIETINTIEHPWSWIGRTQYLKRVASRLNEIKPDILILSNYTLLPIVDFLKFKPQYIIHQVLEELDQFGDSLVGRNILKRIKRIAPRVDFWIFPEQNRAIHDAYVLGIPYEKISIFYNVLDQLDGFEDITKKNKRFLYAGSVDFNRTVAKYFTNVQVYEKPIDVFGEISGPSKECEQFQENLKRPKSKIRYFGEVSAEVINKKLSEYSFSLVYWFPISFSTRNAAPNKFFQAIAAGVPVLAAPHPQCIELINRYNCGIVLKDWSEKSFLSGLNLAMHLFDTKDYEAMLDGCKKAYNHELSWNRQFLGTLKKMKL